MVSWFHRFRVVNGFIVSCVRGFIGLAVSMVSWFHRFRGVKGFMVSYFSWCQWFHGFIGLMVSLVS